jgi:hypothetical protein
MTGTTTVTGEQTATIGEMSGWRELRIGQAVYLSGAAGNEQRYSNHQTQADGSMFHMNCVMGDVSQEE